MSSNALPSPLCDEDSCCEPLTTQIPGPQGPPGADGTNGTDGVNAYTFLGAGFVVPAEGNTVQATFLDTSWMVQEEGAIQGQIIYIGFAGHYEVVTVDSPTLATIRNLSDVATGMYPDNAPPTANIPNSAKVSPAGLQGPDGTIPAGALLAANNLSDVDNVATSRGSLGLGSSATLDAGKDDGDVALVDDASGLVNGEAVFATAAGIESKTAANSRTALGLGSMATQNAGAVTISGGVITGITDLAITDGGTGASSAAAARVNLGVLAGYGLIGSAFAIDLNAGASDNAIPMLATRYIVDRITVDNASISLTTATLGLFTAAGGGGTAIAADQVLTALTAASKYLDLTEEAIVATDVFTAATLYARVGTPQGAAATADIRIYGWKLN